MGGMGLGMLIVGLIGCNRYGAVAMLVFSIGILGAASSGFCTNSVDLAPKYAGPVLFMISNIEDGFREFYFNSCYFITNTYSIVFLTQCTKMLKLILSDVICSKKQLVSLQIFVSNTIRS